jgi:hypothetical protein
MRVRRREEARGCKNPWRLGGLATLLFFWPRGASADAPFVDRPVTLAPLHFSADVGLGFGQYEAFAPNPNDLEGPPVSTGNKVGLGTNLEAAVGLPFLGQFGVRMGYRFDTVGAYAQADHFGRLFDPVVNEPGNDSWTNPELSLRGTLVSLPMLEVALETRAILPTASGSTFAIVPGAPVRVHLPTLARIDTGLYVPISFASSNDDGSGSSTSFAVQVPAQLFLQLGDSFVGPFTGLLFVTDGSQPNPQITAGVGGGHTFGSVLDLKVQVYTPQLNDVSWMKHIGGGVGVGLRM